MTRKRMIKLLMSVGCDRNDAAYAATLADGSLSYDVLYYNLCEEFLQAFYELQRRFIIEGDHSGEPAGIVGSMYG
nr:MAG TPA: hypothetical protein [Caudoviricetes sp.]